MKPKRQQHKRPRELISQFPVLNMLLEGVFDQSAGVSASPQQPPNQIQEAKITDGISHVTLANAQQRLHGNGGDVRLVSGFGGDCAVF